VRKATIGVAGVVTLVFLLAGVAHADDVADVKAAEVAFNAAYNAGRLDGMSKYWLQDRTIYGPNGGGLTVG
jgi:hypothetical protein